jgi:CheY-like chemotaxis protein
MSRHKYACANAILESEITVVVLWQPRNRAVSAREVRELLRTATVCYRAGRSDEAARAVDEAAALITRFTEAADRRRDEIRAQVAAPVAPSRRTVLIVDDEPAVLKVLAVAFGLAGCAVATAGTGPEAVAAVRDRSDIGLVLLDVQMPAPWDGPRTLTEFRRLGATVPVVFMSGSTGRYEPHDLLALGARRIYAKPFPSLRGFAAEVCGLLGG